MKIHDLVPKNLVQHSYILLVEAEKSWVKMEKSYYYKV